MLDTPCECFRSFMSLKMIYQRHVKHSCCLTCLKIMIKSHYHQYHVTNEYIEKTYNNKFSISTLDESCREISLKDLSSGKPWSAWAVFWTCSWNFPGWCLLYSRPNGTKSWVSHAAIISSGSSVAAANIHACQQTH